MRWCLLIEEFVPEFRHIKGKHNLIDDALSMLELDDSSEESNLERPTTLCMAAKISRTEMINDELSPTDGFEMVEAFGIKSKKKTKDEDYEFPMQIPYIAKIQDKDKSLMKKLMKSDHKYELNKKERTAVLTLNGKIFISRAIINPVIDWYHQYLCHPGATRTKATIRNTTTWPGLIWNVQSHCKTCKVCQFNKKTRKQYGNAMGNCTGRLNWTLKS
jgi:hypothetical protein